MKIREVKKIYPSMRVMEGAGVRLNRLFGFQRENPFDPFLLLDDFSSENPEDYIRGFPWHPHRGIETITYILSGEVEHQDSLGNKGVIGAGDIQWMTAGSGIIHQEMPRRAEKRLQGFQLWANLPRTQKMMAPRYRDVISSSIPKVKVENGIIMRIIAGKYNEIQGPVQDIVITPEYFDVSMPQNSTWRHSVTDGFTALVYIFEGKVQCDQTSTRTIPAGNVVKYSEEGEIQISTQDSPARFLFISGKPLQEPVAWRGPIVMNTQEELDKAFWEVQNDQFIKHKI